MLYQVLTTVILGLHFAFVVYVVLGGFLAWRWPRAIWPHLLAAGWGLAIVAERVDCPLTWAEGWSRQQAGEAGVTKGFIDRYVEGVLYPERYAGLVQAVCAGVVAVSWAGAYALWRRHRHAARESLPIRS
ncbi:MAG: DUF2784 domain-containing protein [Jiangellaceae bacterium]